MSDTTEPAAKRARMNSGIIPPIRQNESQIKQEVSENDNGVVVGRSDSPELESHLSCGEYSIK